VNTGKQLFGFRVKDGRRRYIVICLRRFFFFLVMIGWNVESENFIAITFWVSRADFFCFPLNDGRFPDEGYGSDSPWTITAPENTS
jgi:hypothetical protein